MEEGEGEEKAFFAVINLIGAPPSPPPRDRGGGDGRGAVLVAETFTFIKERYGKKSFGVAEYRKSNVKKSRVPTE